MGGSSVKVPGPSVEERALQKNQSELLVLQRQILEQQRAQQAVLLPFFAEQEGFQVETDQFGNITHISKTPTELENMKKDLETQLTKRSLDALAGNLPVSPGLERDIGKTEETLREKLGQQLGTGYETSSAGIEALAKQHESADVLREGARTAQLTLAEQLGITREQQNAFSQQNALEQLHSGAVGDPLGFAGAFGQNAAGFGKAQEPFIQQRQMQLQASIANSQRSSPFASIAGTVLGGLFSDERLKTEIEPIGLDLCPGVPICTFRFNFEGEDAPMRLGVIAQDVQKVFPEAVGELDGYLTVDPKLLSNLVRMSKANMRLAS